MARGRTLLSLLQDYRAEVGASSNPAHNAGVRDEQVMALQKTQERLWRQYAWPFLRVERFIDLQAGQRYYDPRVAIDADGEDRTDLGVERLEHVGVCWGGEWTDMLDGITPRHYAVHDSYRDERGWPVERWRVVENDMIEVWPVPDTNAGADLEGRLRLIGIRDLQPLVADGDRADLDDTLIVKYAAARKLARLGAKDAQLMLDEAQMIERALVGNFTKAKTFSLAGREPEPRLPKGPPTVHYRPHPAS